MGETKAFTTPFNSVLALSRFPERRGELLQAWDTADELLLKYLHEHYPSGSFHKLLLLNDSFGALACALEGLPVTSYTDSYMSAQGAHFNSGGKIQCLSRLEDLRGPYDLVLARIPRNLSFFEDTLAHLSAHLAPGATIICGTMVKYQAKGSFDLLNEYIGPTTTSLAWKKARLIFAPFERSARLSPYPKEVRLDSFSTPFTHHSNLFSREKLDIGTRFLLEHIPEGEYPVILDLGCANGVVGIRAQELNPAAKIVFSDESQMALQSARLNYAKFFPEGQAEFHWTHAGAGQPLASVDLVLCNPPFHQGNAQGDTIAWEMFTDARRVLRSGGTLRVIGNTHLRYPSALKHLFGNSRIVEANAKFTIVDAEKS